MKLPIENVAYTAAILIIGILIGYIIQGQSVSGYEVDMHEVDMHEVDMHEVDMHEVDMREVDMREVDMHVPRCLCNGMGGSICSSPRVSAINYKNGFTEHQNFEKPVIKGVRQFNNRYLDPMSGM